MLDKLPDLLYNFSSKPLDVDFLLVKNIWRRAEILVEFKSEVTIFTEITVADGERPEDIAATFYNNPFYSWTVLIANDITDIYSQWPRSITQLQEFIAQKYDNPQATKHHITTEVKDSNNNIIVPAGKIVASNYQVAYYNGSTTVTATPVVSITNEQFEFEKNAEKSRIQLIKPSIIEDFVEVYVSLLSKGRQEIVGVSASDINM
tara:strand:+ start:1019 stop:1633 length:615 start_codon:yes stop_codon:yes gene_type:complete